MSRRLVWLALLSGLCCLAPTVKAQAVDPKELEIVGGDAGLDPTTGFLRISGELWNRSKHWIASPKVYVRLLDADGKPIAVDSILTMTKKELGKDPVDSVVAERELVPPGEVAVFEYLRDPAKLGGATYASHKLVPAARRVSKPPQASITDLSATKGADGWYAATGSIHNDGPVPCHSPRVVLGLYHADGKLYRALSNAPDATFQKDLKAGESVAFEVKAIPNPGGDAIAEVKAWGDCAVPH